MNNKEKGNEGEQRAAFYLKTHLYKIIQMNYRCRLGEIDIIAKKGSCLVFVEVKYRKNANMGQPYEAVNYQKQQRIKKVAAWYLMEKNLGDVECRFDVISILDSKITHFKNAF